MKLMIPFTPHLAHECLELANCKTPDKWPKIDKKHFRGNKFSSSNKWKNKGHYFNKKGFF